jgi:uncharacterized MAPEG superfamily protein
MSTELYWLTLTALMTALFWLVYILDRMTQRGVIGTLTSTQPETGGGHSPWAQRAMRAHQNAVENLVIFAPLVLIAHMLQVSTPATRAATVVYFFARLAHFIVFSAGIPMGRTLAFTAGWLATLVMAFSILRWI